MKKVFKQILDTLISGIIFLLPILIVLVLASKAMQMLTGFSTKLASLFGLKSMMGVSGTTIAGTLLLLVICLLCGLLVRLRFAKKISKRLDNMLSMHIPGYKVYREMALSKLENKEDLLPYECSACIDQDGMLTPCFVMETLPDGRIMIFIPTAGNVKEGTVYATTSDRVRKFPQVDMKKYQMAISNLGLGVGELLKQNTKAL